MKATLKSLVVFIDPASCRCFYWFISPARFRTIRRHNITIHCNTILVIQLYYILSHFKYNSKHELNPPNIAGQRLRNLGGFFRTACSSCLLCSPKIVFCFFSLHRSLINHGFPLLFSFLQSVVESSVNRFCFCEASASFWSHSISVRINLTDTRIYWQFLNPAQLLIFHPNVGISWASSTW